MNKLTDQMVKEAIELVDLKLKTIKWTPEEAEFRESLELINTIASQVLELSWIPSPPDKLMEHMTEPELADHLNKQLRFIKGCQTEDTVGSMLLIFQKDMICQYGATVDPETAPQALRELADRLEKRETVKR